MEINSLPDDNNFSNTLATKITKQSGIYIVKQNYLHKNIAYLKFGINFFIPGNVILEALISCIDIIFLYVV